MFPNWIIPEVPPLVCLVVNLRKRVRTQIQTGWGFSSGTAELNWLNQLSLLLCDSTIYQLKKKTMFILCFQQRKKVCFVLTVNVRACFEKKQCCCSAKEETDGMGENCRWSLKFYLFYCGSHFNAAHTLIFQAIIHCEMLLNKNLLCFFLVQSYGQQVHFAAAGN